MKKIYFVKDSAGYVCHRCFTSKSKAKEYFERLSLDGVCVYDFPLIIGELHLYEY